MSGRSVIDGNGRQVGDPVPGWWDGKGEARHQVTLDHPLVPRDWFQGQHGFSMDAQVS